MILADSAIAAALANESLVIYPRPAVIQPASVDLHLGPRVMVDGTAPCRLPLQLRTGQRLIASTAEWVELPVPAYRRRDALNPWRRPALAGRLEGKSTWARLFLFVHAAGFIDPGFRGELTLELVYLGAEPILLCPGAAICQLALFTVSGRVLRPYGHPELSNHYQNQAGPTAARGPEGSASGGSPGGGVAA